MSGASNGGKKPVPIPVEAYYWRQRGSMNPEDAIDRRLAEERKRNTCPCGYPGSEPCHGCPDGCKREGLA